MDATDPCVLEDGVVAWHHCHARHARGVGGRDGSRLELGVGNASQVLQPRAVAQGPDQHRPALASRLAEGVVVSHISTGTPVLVASGVGCGSSVAAAAAPAAPELAGIAEAAMSNGIGT